MNRLMDVPIIRSLAWRVGRKLYCMARRESANQPEKNGEYWLLAQAISKGGSAPVLLDIGANRGNWSHEAASLLCRHKRSGRVVAFEPAAATFAHLSDRFRNSTLVEAVQTALSSEAGEVEFFATSELAGTNSLYESEGSTMERVRTIPLDALLRERGIDHVSFVKSDTEGHDFNVLRGAADALSGGKVDLWQFEYNHRWIAAGATLKDVFDFVADKPYLFGKLYGNGIEAYSAWHPELERYIETNYVLVRKGGPLEPTCSPMAFDRSNVAVSA